MPLETGKTEREAAEAYLTRALDRAMRAGVPNPGVAKGVETACAMLALYTARTGANISDLTARELKAIVSSEVQIQAVNR